MLSLMLYFRHMLASSCKSIAMEYDQICALKDSNMRYQGVNWLTTK